MPFFIDQRRHRPIKPSLTSAQKRATIEVNGLPSNALVPLFKDNTLDLACITRTKGVTGATSPSKRYTVPDPEASMEGSACEQAIRY